MEAADPREVDAEVEALHGEAEPAQAESEEEALTAADLDDFKVTAPIFPWEVVLRSSRAFFQRTPSGGMQLKFCPTVPGPGGQTLPMPPGFVVEFSAANWERFKAIVADDGDAPPTIQTATALPSIVIPASG